METFIWIILILLLLLNGGLIWYFVFRKKPEVKKENENQGFLLLQNQLNSLINSIDNKLGESSKIVNDSIKTQFTESAKLIKDVTAGLTKLDETNRQVVSFADQLKSLQDILKNPKQRGILGEYYLEAVLKNVLPPGSYKMQYSLGNDTIVDAVVFIKDKIIPIDSKFSLENYNRFVSEKETTEKSRLEKIFVNDLKNRITETSKYIQPALGTMDFAFMFIPHEAIYYDLLVGSVGQLNDESENLIQRAASKYKVIIVSPTSFLAYLQTVLQGLRGMQIEESVKGVIKNVGELGKHLKAFDEYHTKLGSSLATTVNHFMTSRKEFKKVDKDVLRITGEGIEIEQLTIDKPDKEED